MNQEDKIIENIKKCNRFSWCSVNICPLDPESRLRKELPSENKCPFTINKKAIGQKGMRTLIPIYILKVIPKSNLKMLNRANLRLWQGLHKDNEEK
jgi:hypothetical protein